MGEVSLDEHIITATRDALKNLSNDMPGLLSRAAALDVSDDVSSLKLVSQWASDTATDLTARIGLIHRLENHKMSFGDFKVTPAEMKQMAGASVPVQEQLYVLEGVSKVNAKASLTGVTKALAWDGSKNFSDWVEKVEIKAAEQLPLLDEHGKLVSKGIKAFHQYSELLAVGGMTRTAITALGKNAGVRLLLNLTTKWEHEGAVIRGTELPAWISGRLPQINRFLNGQKSMSAPGKGMGFLKGQVYKRLIAEGKFEETLSKLGSNSRFSDLMAHNAFVRANFNRLTHLANSPAMKTVSRWGGNIFGRPWVDANGATIARNSTNLAKVFRAEGFTSTLRVAGGLRVLGVAGSAFATVDSTIGLVNSFRSGEEQKAWSEGGTKGKAKVIGDFAEVGFNASLTAAMIAPNPVTWGAVAVTGIVYGGARLVEHWDDVTHAVGAAKDWTVNTAKDVGNWAKDTAGEAVDDVKDGLGDAVDAVKDSPINPGNWF